MRLPPADIFGPGILAAKKFVQSGGGEAHGDILHRGGRAQPERNARVHERLKEGNHTRQWMKPSGCEQLSIEFLLAIPPLLDLIPLVFLRPAKHLGDAHLIPHAKRTFELLIAERQSDLLSQREPTLAMLVVRVYQNSIEVEDHGKRRADGHRRILTPKLVIEQVAQHSDGSIFLEVTGFPAPRLFPLPAGSALAEGATLVESPAMKYWTRDSGCSLRSGLVALAMVLSACEEATTPPEVPAAPLTTSPESAPAPPVAPQFWSEVTLHEAIRAANPGYTGNGQFQIDQRGQVQAMSLDDCGITDFAPLRGMPLMALSAKGCQVPDIEALRGMPLVELYLEQTGIKDLGPLAGMATLRKLYLSGTPIIDLSPLKGLSLVEMNLVETPVSDLGPLAGAPLQMLWLTDTPVKDITPLAKCPLVSLTLHRTAVSDLSPLAHTRLQRLHIGETPVTDLAPLADVPLTRLVFEKGQITAGLDVVKQIPTLQEIGSKFEDGANDLKPPAVFWAE